MSPRAFLAGVFRQLLRDLAGHRLRTGLTVLGILWGTLAIALLLAFGEGLERRMETETEMFAEDSVIVWPRSTSRAWKGNPSGRRIVLTHEDVAALRSRVAGLAGVTGEGRAEGVPVRAGRKTLVRRVSGVDEQFATLQRLVPEEGGRVITAEDVASRRRVVVLGDKLRTELLGPGVAVGQEVTLERTPFTVVGVLASRPLDEDYPGADSHSAFVPASTFESAFGSPELDVLAFRPARRDDLEDVRRRVVDVLAERHRFHPRDEEAVGMWDMGEGKAFIETFLTAFRLFLGGVGIVTLVVAGIGVSNIMDVVVQERTSEIGLKMALGARPSWIAAQVLGETLALAFVGGLAGLACAAGICAVAGVALRDVQEYLGLPVLSPVAVLGTVVLLAAVGAMAGWLPARAAARLDPVEALRR